MDIKQLYNQFIVWAEGRTGYTTEQLIDLFSTPYNLTQEEKKLLTEEIKAKQKKKIPEPPPIKKKEPPQEKPPPKKDLIIERIPYPKWWNDSLNARISLTAPGSQTLATVSGKLKLFVSTIALTVTGETQITFSFGNAGTSGPIYLGGENQPKGIVIAMGNSPAPCGNGSLVISATAGGGGSPSIGGFATVFVMEIKEKKK